MKATAALAVVACFVSCAALGCQGHPWFDPPPQDLPRGNGARLWMVLPSMIQEAAARLETRAFVEITSSESNHFTGQSYFDDIPGRHLVLIRGIRNNVGSPMAIQQADGVTTVISFSYGGVRRNQAVTWPVVAKLENLPSRVYVACWATGL